MSDIFTFSEQIEKPLHSTTTTLHVGDCLQIITQENFYDAIITDPPYLISLHKKDWDTGNITFSAELWSKLFTALKPGGYIAAFAMPRLYHRMAIAAEDAGFELYPFALWKFDGGLPKPANLSELFDRDNIQDREIIGYRNGSGFTKANVDHGAQSRTHTEFPIYKRNVSPEAQQWEGYYYGVNTLKPCYEPILIAQKPVKGRMIDNVRDYGVGAMNIDVLKNNGNWPTTIFEHKKAKKSEHNSTHPSVKPVSLMKQLCQLLCPTNGLILDPFAGTGTTGVAAKNLGFNCVLIEQNLEMESVIRRRVS